MPSKICLILRSAQRARLEGRTTVMQLLVSILSQALPRIDVDGGQRRVFVRMAAGASSLRVDVDRKSPGRVGREREFGDCSRGNAFFDVIPVKMQDNGLIACQPQLHDIAFIDADEPHRVWDAATLDLDVECELRGESRRAGGNQQQRQRPVCRNETQHSAPLPFIDRNLIEHPRCD
jgi:hypothetical protein